MLSQKLFHRLNKIALFAIVFASLGPSISHALQANNGAGFAQEICSTNGKKITIQVITSKGQQLETEFATESSNNKTPTSIQHHLAHCPFCANPSTDAALQAPHAPIIALLSAQAEQLAAVNTIVFSSFASLPPPSQAPPSIL